MNIKKLHRYVALGITLPLIFITVTGVLLLFRNQMEWLQPKTLRLESQSNSPILGFEEISKKFGPDIEQIIYRPSKNNISVRMLDGEEIQMHPQSGEIVKRAVRRTGILINFHQGSWLGPFGQYVLHAAAGLGLGFLIYSGFMIWPFWQRKKHAWFSFWPRS